MKEISLTRILELTIPAIIVFAVSWGIYTTRSNAQEAEIKDLKIKYNTILEMKTDIAVIKEQVAQINKNLEKYLDY